MTKFIIYILLATAQLATATIYIHPNRNDLAVTALHLSLPEALYTNLVSYYSAEVPIQSAGTTDFLIPDLSPSRADASQPDLTAQPLHAPAGVAAWNFDGTNDCIIKPASHQLNKTYAILVRFPDEQFPAEWSGADGGLFGSHVATYNYVNAGIRPGYDWLVIRGGHLGEYTCQTLQSFDPVLYGSWHWVIFRLNAVSNQFLINVEATVVAVTPSEPIVTPTSTTRIGDCLCGGVLDGTTSMPIAGYMEFSVALTDAQTTALLAQLNRKLQTGGYQ